MNSYRHMHYAVRVFRRSKGRELLAPYNNSSSADAMRSAGVSAIGTVSWWRVVAESV